MEKSLNDLTAGEISGTWTAVHKKVSSGFQNGLLLANVPEVNLPEGYHNGFKDPISGTVKSSFIVYNGYLLFGPVQLNPVSHVLEIVHEDALASALTDAMDPHSLDLLGAKEIDIFFTLDYFRSTFQEAGRKVSFVFQPVNSRIIPTGAHEKIISGSVSVKKLLEGRQFNLADYVDKNLKNFEEISHQFKKNVFQIVEDSVNTKSTTGFSFRNEWVSEYINSYVDESGSFKLGLNDFELGFLYKLLVPNIKSMDYSITNKDNIVYKLFNIDFTKETNIHYSMRRSTQSTKQLFNEYLKLFKQFSEIDPTTVPIELCEVVIRLNEETEHFRNNPTLDFQINELDPTDSVNKYFMSKEELILAQRINYALIRLIGGNNFRDIFLGSIFPKNGYIRHINRPWAVIRRNVLDLSFSLESLYGHPALVIVPSHLVSYENKFQYLYDRVVQPATIPLPINPSDSALAIFSLSNPGISNLRISGVPLRVWTSDLGGPFFEPMIADKRMKFYTTLSQMDQQYYLKNFRTSSDLSEDFLRFESLTTIVGIIRKIYEDIVGLDITGMADKVLQKEFTTLEVSNARNQLFTFLTSYGLEATSLEFQYRHGARYTLLLNRDIYDVYFKNREDLTSLIKSLEKKTIYSGTSKDSRISLTKEALRFSQDRIISTLDFVWSLTYKSDGTRRKVYLYFLPKNSEGFGYRDLQYRYLPVMSGPDWNLFSSMSSIQARGIVLDPEHPELFNPSEILAAMNIENALCVARTSDMADNEILFAFDEFQPYMPHLVKNENRRVIGPDPDGLTEKNTHEFLTLYFKYWQIVQRFKMVDFYNFGDSNDFYNIFSDDTDSLIWFITQYDPPYVFDPRWYN